MVTETPDIYTAHVRPYIAAQRDAGRLNWVFNILEGRTEQEDVIFRSSPNGSEDQEGFLLLPDLNWDRSTLTSLHLLALVQRRDIWTLRDLTRAHVPWLKDMRENVLEAATRVYPGIERDELKLYVHCESNLPALPLGQAADDVRVDQPTYYHFHIHIVHVMLEAGTTQATGKAFGLENIISQLETMGGSGGAGLADVSLTYILGEANDLWKGVFETLKANAGAAKLE